MMKAADSLISREEFYGLLVAVECLQEVLFAHDLTSPAQLAENYEKNINGYRAAGREEVASALELLRERILDPNRLTARALFRSSPLGSA